MIFYKRNVLLYFPYMLFGVGLAIEWLISTGVKVGFGEICIVIFLPFFSYKNITSQQIDYIYYSIKDYLSLFVIFLLVGLMGVTFGVIFIGDEYAIKNIFSILRLSFYLIVIVITISIVSFSSFNIYKSLLWGGFFASIVNLVFWFSNGNLFVSLPGQNMLGFVISIIFSYSLYLCIYERANFLSNIINISILFLLSFAVLLTWSKGAWINICMIVLFMGIRFILTAPLFSKFVFSIGIMVLTLFIWCNYSQHIIRIISVEISASEGSRSSELRVEQIYGGLIVGLNYPFGTGNKTYPLALKEIGFQFSSSKKLPPDPHNSYAQVMSGFGAFGLSIYLLLLLYPLLFLHKNKYLIPVDRVFLHLCIIFSVYFQALFTGQAFTQPICWVVFGAVMGDVIKFKLVANRIDELAAVTIGNSENERNP